MRRPSVFLIEHPDGTKTSIQVPWLAEGQYGAGRKSTIKDEAEAYAKVPVIFRAVRMRCNGLTRVPLYLWDGENEVDEWPFQETMPLNTLLWNGEASILLRGASYFVRLLDNGQVPIGLQFLNPFTVNQKLVDVKLDGGGSKKELIYWQIIEGKRLPVGPPDYWPREQMFYLRDFNPTDDIGPGTAAASVGLMSTQVQHYLTRFSAQFFENGAMPVTMLNLPAGTQKAEKERVQNVFKEMMSGVKNAFRVIATTGETKAQILTPELKSMELEKIGLRAIQDVAWAYEIPASLLEGKNANYAEAEVQKRNFIEDTISPRSIFFEAEVNALLKSCELDFTIEFAPQEMHEMQKDEAAKATAFASYVAGGMPPQMAAAIVGVNVPEAWQAWMSIGKEGPGAEATPDVGGSPRTEDLDDLPPTPGEKPGPKPPPQKKPATGSGPDVNAAKTLADIRRWERKAITRLKNSKRPQCEYQTDTIPNEVKSQIYHALAHTQSSVEVHNVFRQFRREGGGASGASFFVKGGAGSDNFGHAGIPGEQGGSASEGGSGMGMTTAQMNQWKDGSHGELQGEAEIAVADGHPETSGLVMSARESRVDGKTIYRGIAVDNAKAEGMMDWAKGKSIQMMPSSFSTSETTANSFAADHDPVKERPIQFRVEAKTGEKIRGLKIRYEEHESVQHEREVISGGKYTVVGHTTASYKSPMGNGNTTQVHVIRLRQTGVF